MGSEGALSGLTVLVTRPAHQAASLAAAIEALGAEVLQFPVLEIRDAPDPGALAAAIEALDRYDWAVFVSVNAVERGATAVLARRAWPAGVRVAAIGRSSARALEALGVPVDLVPERRYSSEGLLETGPMQRVAGQRILIFRGEGGREHLATTLRARGARVDHVACYRRGPPEVDGAPLNRMGRRSDVVVVNSGESLENLCALAGEEGRAWLPGAQLVVASDRIAGLARALGFEKRPVVAANATDEAVVEALLAWRRTRPEAET